MFRVLVIYNFGGKPNKYTIAKWHQFADPDEVILYPFVSFSKIALFPQVIQREDRHLQRCDLKTGSMRTICVTVE